MDVSERESICIVGNSSSVKGKGFGVRIDEFPQVCRINNWVVKGHHKDVGTKITHWVTGAGKQTPAWSKNRSLKDKYTIILWPYPLFNTWTQWARKKNLGNKQLYDAVPEIKQTLLNRLGYPLDKFTIWKDNDTCDLYDTRENITFVPEYVCERISANTVAYPTTGLATIAYFKFVLRYNVFTVGFDFFLKNKDHYWENGQNACKVEFHNLQKEKQIYDKWVEEGLIYEL